jgi:uncharacterized membrane protein
MIKGVELSDHQRSGLSENLAALLSYVFGWITGLIFLLLDKRPYVRFHAAQSIVVFLGLQSCESSSPRHSAWGGGLVDSVIGASSPLVLFF